MTNMVKVPRSEARSAKFKKARNIPAHIHGDLVGDKKIFRRLKTYFRHKLDIHLREKLDILSNGTKVVCCTGQTVRNCPEKVPNTHKIPSPKEPKE